MHPLHIPFMALLFGVADRLAGGAYVSRAQAWIARKVAGWPPLARDLAVTIANARAVLWASVALAVSLALLGAATSYGPSLAALALGFALWRWEGWAIFGGGIDPHTRAQITGYFERQLLAVPSFVLAGGLLLHWSVGPLIVVAIVAAVFAAYATVLGVVLAMTERPGVDVNAFIESFRGVGLGALLAIALM